MVTTWRIPRAYVYASTLGHRLNLIRHPRRGYVSGDEGQLQQAVVRWPPMRSTRCRWEAVNIANAADGANVLIEVLIHCRIPPEI